MKEFPTDFRLVSATNRPLQELVAKDEFRGDLFYRINAVVLELPPLRERVGDIPLLVRGFLREFRQADAEMWSIAPDALAVLEGYSWPGNVRELRNVIERAALLARGQTIRAADLGSSLSGEATVASDTADTGAHRDRGSPGADGLAPGSGSRAARCLGPYAASEAEELRPSAALGSCLRIPHHRAGR